MKALPPRLDFGYKGKVYRSSLFSGLDKSKRVKLLQGLNSSRNNAISLADFKKKLAIPLK